jgi:hypothetical protein
MGFWDVLRGRTPPKRPQLDQLFALPSAAMTLQASLGLVPTGTGSVCFRAAEGRAAALTQQDAAALAGAGSEDRITSRVDEYGYTWLTVRHPPDDVAGLVTDLHAINSALEAQDFGTGLLCSVVAFAAEGAAAGAPGAAYLVYLYKQGTFYPFCPTGPHVRDTIRERQLRDAVGADLPIEPDTTRWMPIWGMPSA